MATHAADRWIGARYFEWYYAFGFSRSAGVR